MEPGVNSYVIDACALIAYLRDETGGDKLKALLKEKDKTFFMHSINLGEVYYDSLRVSGKTASLIFPLSVCYYGCLNNEKRETFLAVDGY